MHQTLHLMKSRGFPHLRRKALETLQVNLSYKCNQGYRKNKALFPWALNLQKAGSVVKHCDNRSKNDCIPVQLAQKSQRLCCVLVLQAKDAQG